MNLKTTLLKVQDIILKCSLKKKDFKSTWNEIEIVLQENIDLTRADTVTSASYEASKALMVLYPKYKEFLLLGEDYQRDSLKLEPEEALNLYCDSFLSGMVSFEEDKEISATIEEVLKTNTPKWPLPTTPFDDTDPYSFSQIRKKRKRKNKGKN